MSGTKRRMPLYSRIFVGMVLGVVAGAVINFGALAQEAWWAQGALPLLDFVGRLFIRLITMLVIPLVVASLLIGVASLGDIRKLGRIGAKTIGFYLATTAVAVVIGLTLAVAIKPGSRIAPETRGTLAAEFRVDADKRLALAAARPTTWDVLLNMVPDNPVGAAAQGNLLPLIVFVLLFGAAVTLLVPQQRDAILTFFHGINEAAMILIAWVMRLAPYAVFSLIAVVVSRFGIDVLHSLAIYALVVIAGLLIHTFVTYSVLVALLARLNPIDFFRRIREVPMIAFSTSSSNATLPVTMENAEEKLGISKPISSFVLPLGATINMDGTALYQGVATVFIAQVYAHHLGTRDLLTVVLTATLASIGAAGVPGAGVVTLILVLRSVGLASEAGAGIALILGVDRILDMLRTAVNVLGDLACAAFVARSEGETLTPHR